jgi:hypothetical protein
MEGLDSFLTGAEVRLYGRIARCEGLGGEEWGRGPELAKLQALGLVVRDADHPEVWVALEPGPAMARHTAAQLAAAASRLAQIAALPAVQDQLSVEFERSAERSSGGAQFLPDPETVNARIQDVVGAARSEILSAQPNGPRSRANMLTAVRRDTDALRRGIRCQTLYRDTVRDDEVTQEWARTMAAEGAEYRTLLAPFERIIIVDRRHAFISDYVVEGSAAHAAWHVTDRAVVAYMARVYADIWHQARPWSGEPRIPDTAPVAACEVRTTRLDREILRDMVAGRPQTATASRLGFGVRTLTRHLERLKSLFGAESLPALAYKFALSPDHGVDDSASVDTVSQASGAPQASVTVETAA